jgi:hypothetical protein
VENWRSPKLLKSAKHAPFCCYCGKGNDGTVVMAHSNQSRDGKGMSIKAHDYRVAALCGPCHSDLDQGSTLSREDRVAMWETAHRATIAWLIEAGILVVA